jgi:DNA repair protein RadC
MKITDILPENRPRERLESSGAGVLSSAELLAIILKSGTKKENVLEICNKLLSKHGLSNLPSCTLQELCEEHGIGKAKASQIVALFELYRRIPQKNNIKIITCAKDVASIYLPKLRHLQQEHFVAIYLDTKNKIICDQTLTIGTLNSSVIHSREVYNGAIRNLANGVIVIHNHPSGDPKPSMEDLEVTNRLREAGEIIGIRFLDHIIIGKEKWWSWKEG